MQQANAGRIHQINISAGGVPKHAIARAAVTETGIAGDYHRDTRHHGGPQRALCLYTVEQIRRLREEGHPIEPGWVGENITLEGIELASLVPGTQLMLGAEVCIEITSYTTPCTNITASFAEGDFTRISHARCPGESRVCAKVLRGGEIAPGDTARIIDEAALEQSAG
jgi:MOSC domain-containing protein YiiM